MLGRTLQKITTFAIVVLVVLSYQNCSSPNAEFASSAAPSITAGLPSSSYSGGNGGGYDGKPFVLPDLSGVCTDGDAAKARILEKAGVYKLVRWNCTNLGTAQVVSVTKVSQTSTTAESIIYDKSVFDSQAALVSGTQLPTKGYCTEVTSAATITVPQTVGTDFNVSMLISVSGADLVASMIFDDNSSSDAYATNVVRIGSSSVPAGALNGPFAFAAGAQSLDLNFVNGEAVTRAQNLPVVDTDTPSVTGTLVDFDSTLTKCSWN